MRGGVVAASWRAGGVKHPHHADNRRHRVSCRLFLVRRSVSVLPDGVTGVVENSCRHEGEENLHFWSN